MRLMGLGRLELYCSNFSCGTATEQGGGPVIFLIGVVLGTASVLTGCWVKWPGRVESTVGLRTFSGVHAKTSRGWTGASWRIFQAGKAVLFAFDLIELGGAD